MRTSKQIDYYYKASDITSADEQERKQFEYYNYYGYNTDSSKRRVVDYNTHAKKLKYKINHGFFNQK